MLCFEVCSLCNERLAVISVVHFIMNELHFLNILLLAIHAADTRFSFCASKINNSIININTFRNH